MGQQHPFTHTHSSSDTHAYTDTLTHTHTQRGVLMLRQKYVGKQFHLRRYEQQFWGKDFRSKFCGFKICTRKELANWPRRKCGVGTTTTTTTTDIPVLQLQSNVVSSPSAWPPEAATSSHLVSSRLAINHAAAQIDWSINQSKQIASTEWKLARAAYLGQVTSCWQSCLKLVQLLPHSSRCAATPAILSGKISSSALWNFRYIPSNCHVKG